MIIAWLLLALLLVPSEILAQTGTFKQINMQDVTGAYIRAPRLTLSQRDASTHNRGEIIYCTDCTPVDLYVFDGTAWVPLGGGGAAGVISIKGLQGVVGVTDDTNVRMTTSGQNLVLGWQSLLPVSRGGTGVGTIPSGVIVGNGTNPVSTVTGSATTVLAVPPAGGSPAFSSTPQVSELRLQETGGGTDYIGLSAPVSVTTPRKIVFPALPGPSGQCLSTDGGAPTETLGYSNCVGGTGGLGGSGTAGQAAFWTSSSALGGDSKFLWNSTNHYLQLGTLPEGPTRGGHLFLGIVGPNEVGIPWASQTGLQGIQVQLRQGTITPGLVTLGGDRVGVSSWNFRGTGNDNPIYGANFGVVFSTPGVANGLEIDVQNMSSTQNIGQALWLNGSGTSDRATAILIDTQDTSKWQYGIRFISC
jgi:hypothetical protein